MPAGRKIKIYSVFLLILLNIIVWYAVFYFESHQNLVVTFFDIGQGDAALVEIPGGNQVLIDGGPSDLILAKLGRALPFWDKHIDVLLLTHPHADHLDGLLEVLRRYEIGLVVESGVNHSIPEYQMWQELLESKKINKITAQAGQRIKLGSGAELEILSPLQDFSAKSSQNIHDAVVVSRLAYGAKSFLFMGDAEKELEFKLLPFVVDSDVLKAGHHGSKTSSSEIFLKKISPDLAVISAGKKNRYGHPHQEILDRFRELNINVLRTDLYGDIKIKSDKAGVAVIK